MLNNLKAALFQHKKFLAVFFFIVFLPSLLLAILGIRAIYNEKYKLEQQSLDQRRESLMDIKTGIRSFFEQKSSGLKALASAPAVGERDFGAIRDLILAGLRNGFLSGEIVIWKGGGRPWFPAFQEHPPDEPGRSVPDEWRKLRERLDEAEDLEFRRRDLTKAVAAYESLLSRGRDPLIRAWITNRIARCEAKSGNSKRAAALYRSLAAEAGDLPTESGRPLEISARLELLDCLRNVENGPEFQDESLAAYSRLEKNPWSMDGERIRFYAAMIKAKIDEAFADNVFGPSPEDYLRAIKDHQSGIESRLSAWRLAQTVEEDILPELRRDLENPESKDLTVHQTAFEFGGRDVVAFVAPREGLGGVQAGEFLGMLLREEELRGMIEPLISGLELPGAALLIRSNLTDRILVGSEALNSSSARPVLTDVFHGYFLPWQLELYPAGEMLTGIHLHRNIFFWTILALLVILFIGSGLIIRTLVQEANLLKLKSEFIASVSHEFKTPLTAMGAILEHLLNEKSKDPEKIQEYHQVLQRDSDKLKRLVKNVLDFSKIEDGKMNYRMRPTDIVLLVKREIRSFEEESGIGALSIGFKADEDVPSIPLDEEAVSQALHNILDNAVKFSPKDGEIDVEVRTRPGAVEIAVEDRGIGIPENEQKKIFGKFYRGRQASSVSPTGTGLGLTLVRHIVDAHGGDIVVRSRPGEGCRVSILLPVDRGKP